MIIHAKKHAQNISSGLPFLQRTKGALVSADGSQHGRVRLVRQQGQIRGEYSQAHAHGEYRKRTGFRQPPRQGQGLHPAHRRFHARRTRRPSGRIRGRPPGQGFIPRPYRQHPLPHRRRSAHQRPGICPGPWALLRRHVALRRIRQSHNPRSNRPSDGPQQGNNRQRLDRRRHPDGIARPARPQGHPDRNVDDRRRHRRLHRS